MGKNFKVLSILEKKSGIFIGLGTIKEKYLNKTALHLEEDEYQGTLDNDLIGKEVYFDLQCELEKSMDTYFNNPVLNLGLEPAKLVEKVPFFAKLSPDRIGKVVQLLKPRLVIPGEKIIRKGEVGDAMYFISNGCVEIDLEPEPTHLGSGQFFGEIALVTDYNRENHSSAQP